MLTEAKELFDKAMDCPCCKGKFITKKVRSSRLRLEKRDEDFLNHYKTENPIKYNIFVCPNCGYAAYENKYESIKENEMNIIQANITLNWVQRDFGEVRNNQQAIEAYKLALLQGSMLGYSKLELANICLNIGWLNRMDENEEEERFLILARDQFIEAYNNESLSGTNMTEEKLTYLVAELSRRIGEKETALSWFNTCLNNPNIKMDPALEDMAREQWRLTREK